MQCPRAIRFSRHSLGPTLCWPPDRSQTLVLPLVGWACSRAPGGTGGSRCPGSGKGFWMSREERRAAVAEGAQRLGVKAGAGQRGLLVRCWRWRARVQHSDSIPKTVTRRRGGPLQMGTGWERAHGGAWLFVPVNR